MVKTIELNSQERMKLPNREHAYIPPSKLEGYLLSETHPVGKSKAGFFRQHGFNESNVDLLAKGLLTMGQTEEVREVVSSSYGKKYVVTGKLQTPSGTSVRIQTVWIIEKPENPPRFVTAYPV